MRMSDEQLAAFDELQAIIDTRKAIADKLKVWRAKALEEGDTALAEEIAETNRMLGKLFIRVLHTETKILTAETLSDGTEQLRDLSREVRQVPQASDDLADLLKGAAIVADALKGLPQITWN